MDELKQHSGVGDDELGLDLGGLFEEHEAPVFKALGVRARQAASAPA